MTDLRQKAIALLTLAPAQPVHFDRNGVGTGDEREAMVTYRLSPDEVYLLERWREDNDHMIDALKYLLGGLDAQK